MLLQHSVLKVVLPDQLLHHQALQQPPPESQPQAVLHHLQMFKTLLELLESLWLSWLSSVV
jgi:hypothetical protein